MIKHKIKKILIIIPITLILISFIQNSYGANNEMTLESARNQIADWGVRFQLSEGSKWRYNLTGFAERGLTYCSGYPQSSYTFDCVGCVSYVIHYSIGIDFSGARSGDTGFVVPQNDYGNVRDTTHFELHRISEADQPQKGDVLISTAGEGGSDTFHVAIYAGNGKLVDCASRGNETLRDVNTSTWTEWNTCKFTKFARLISLEGADFTPIEGGVILPDQVEDDDNNETENNGNGGSNVTVDEIDLDLVAETFKYHGMPTDIDYTQKETNLFRWIFDGVTGIVDYICGIILSIIRIPVVGLTSSLESFINAQIYELGV